jgi:O-antigen/teichoic acid export membrane protein
MPAPAPGDDSPAGTPAKTRDGRVSRDASLALLAQIVGAALTGVLTIYLGRALPAAEFGYFTFALSVLALASLLADLGVTTSSGRFLAERREQLGDAAAVFRTTLWLKLQIGVPASVAMFAFAQPLCEEFGTPGATWAVRASALALLAQSIFSLFLAAYIALGRLRYNVVLATIESMSEAVATFALVAIGATATGAAFGRTIGFTVGMLAGVALAGRAIGSLRPHGRDRSVLSPRQILAYARPLLLVDAAFRVFSSIDVLLIAALVGGGARIAAFGLPMRAAAFLEFPAAAHATAIAPRLARQRDEDFALLSEGLRYLIIVQLLVTAPLLIWPEAIIHLLFGARFSEAPGVLRALSPYVLLGGIAQLATLAVNYLGYARRRVPIAVAMLTVNVVIDVILLPRIGIVAGAIGTSAAYAIWVPAHAWILRQHTGLRLRPLLLTTLRSCIAGAAMVGVLALIGTGVVAAPLMLAGAVAGPLAYVAALFALRELTPADVVFVRRLVARRAA